VKLSKNATGISGEACPWCPVCGSGVVNSGPVQDTEEFERGNNVERGGEE
jgi:hypothetical protein